MKEFKDWDLISEPEPVHADPSHIFPDFLLRNRNDPNQTWFLEIIGIWMPDYLKRKFDAIRMAKLDRFILCIDHSRNYSDQTLPPNTTCVFFKKRVAMSSIRSLLTTTAC